MSECMSVHFVNQTEMFTHRVAHWLFLFPDTSFKIINKQHKTYRIEYILITILFIIYFVAIASAIKILPCAYNTHREIRNKSWVHNCFTSRHCLWNSTWQSASMFTLIQRIVKNTSKFCRHLYIYIRICRQKMTVFNAWSEQANLIKQLQRSFWRFLLVMIRA